MATTALDPTALRLDIETKQSVSYCIPLWLRDEQIRASIGRVTGRVAPSQALRSEPIALVGYGPSLNDTWELLRDFPIIMTCSGAHRFLIDRGIIPTYHLDVDPRPHKATLIGTPHPDVEYLMASTCHPEVFDLLEGFNVKLWHIFDSAEEGFRILPPGEWALTGGAGAGLRMLALARCLGFTSQHIFGLDGNEGPSGKHAAAHPSQAKKHFTVDYDGVTYTTTPAFLECAKAVFHELDAMPDVTATFYGDGLVQHMARHYVRGAKVVPPNLAVSKPELISTALRALNARLHRDNLAYGVGGGKHAPAILNLSIALKTTSILDYGCGKGYLAKALPFPIWEYDPAIPGKDACPRPADIVVCTDVLEHVEDGKVQYVLKDISRCLRRVGYLVIHLGPASKTYADGRNTHLTQRGQTWWEGKLAKFFHVATVIRRGPELHVVIAPLGVPDPVVSPTEVAARALLPPPEPLPLLNLATVAVCHDPYVVGGATDVLAPEVYAQLTAAFPPLAIFDAGTKKRALSEVHAAEAYHAFLAQTPIWARFHAMVKAPGFVEQLFTVLRPLGFDLPTAGAFTSRFEFSRLPADGGGLLPHTDIPSKVVTIVLPMRGPNDAWQDAWGGGTAILRPRDPAATHRDYQADPAAFETVTTYPYAANQAVVFMKTAASWHSVTCGGTAGLWRKTVTINVERVL